jgi:hypothetical protein
MDEIISYKMCAVKVRNAKLRNYLKDAIQGAVCLITTKNISKTPCLHNFISSHQGKILGGIKTKIIHHSGDLLGKLGSCDQALID